MKKLLMVLGLVATFHTIFAQALFTYGPLSVSKDEFLKAFQKNNAVPEDRKAALKEYLELYTRFKLKVKAAYDMKLDTLPNQQADLLSFRKQIEEPYMNDDGFIKKLAEEAFNRSLKDIRLQHIFIPYNPDYVTISKPATKEDSTKAKQKMQEAYNKLKAGEDFGKVATEYSADPDVKTTKGDMGHITLFTLPYDLENIAYALADGKFSAPYESSAGYHIFKKLAERNAWGKMKAAQILIAYEPAATAEEKLQKKNLADSLYKALEKGSSFDALARQFSNDKLTYLTGGVLPDITVGRYNTAFEDKVFALRSDGELSWPFETSYGIHIVKRLQHKPVEKDKNTAAGAMKQAVTEDSRAQLAKKSFEQSVLKKVTMKKLPVDEKALWQVTDSFVKKNTVVPVKGITEKTVLYSFPKSNITAGNWLQYARTFLTTGETPGLTYPKLMQQYISYTAVEYYRNHLEDYNAEFKSQLNEFKDGNLLFEVMEKQVWSKAAADSTGLKKYYSENKEKYQWGPSADALMVTASDPATAEEAKKRLKDNISNWRKITDEFNGKVAADSGRYEITQIPDAHPAITQPATFSSTVINPQDSSAYFAYVIKPYTSPGVRSFEDAKGLVMNDYQNVLEEKWIAELKKKYPVKVEQKVFQGLLSKLP